MPPKSAEKPAKPAIEPFDWRAIAEQMSLRLKSLSSDEFFMVGKRHGVEVTMDIRQDAVYLKSHIFIPSTLIRHSGSVEIQATYAVGHGPKLRLLREGTMRSLLKRYGYQDIELGNRLDMALTIKGEPPQMVKGMLIHAVEELEVAIPDRKMKLVGSDGISLRSHVSMSTEDRRASITRLDACVNLVTRMAATDFCGYEELCALPDAEKRSSKQLPRSVVVRIPTTVEFIPVFETDRFMTTAQVILPSSGQDTTLALTEVAAIEARSGMQDLPRMLRPVGDASLTWKSFQLTLRWNNVVKEQSQLLAGAQLLSRLSMPSSRDAYR